MLVQENELKGRYNSRKGRVLMMSVIIVIHAGAGPNLIHLCCLQAEKKEAAHSVKAI